MHAIANSAMESIGQARQDDLDRHEDKGDDGRQPRLVFGPVVTLAQKDMVASPAAMVMRRRGMTMAVMVMAMVVTVMDMPGMNVLVRHGVSLAPNSK